MRENKVYIVNSSREYENLFASVPDWEVVNNLWGADLVVFTGGEDVDPRLYKEIALASTYCNPERDAFEKYAFNQANTMGTPMVGICRGAQFLNVMNGGLLWQDVDCHTYEHALWDAETHKQLPIEVTSTHHQMMIPTSDGKLVAYALEAQLKRSDLMDWKRTRINENTPDAEVVWYEATKSFCFQPHPEFPEATDTRQYFFSLLNKYITL